MRRQHNSCASSFREPSSYFELHRGSAAIVEDLSTHTRTDKAGVPGHSGRRHIVLPYRGSFQWHVGKRIILGDPGQALFVNAEEEYQVSHPFGGDASLVLWPNDETMSELATRQSSTASIDILFGRRSRLISNRSQILAHELRKSAWVGFDPLALEELSIQLLDSLVTIDRNLPDGRDIPRSKIDLAREFLHERLCEPISLDEVANGVGLSAIYLTQAFSRILGAPLHRYVIHLRLARALDRLAECDDLTDLALELGFSSHSHFTSAFGRHFGETPSQMRSRFRRVASKDSMQFPPNDRPGQSLKPLLLCPSRSDSATEASDAVG